MPGWLRSRALQWSAIFWSLSALATHEALERWTQYREARQSLQALRERSQSLESELGRLKRLAALIAHADPRLAAASLHERLALLIARLRAAEPLTRVTLQTLSAESGSVSERRAVTSLVQPLPGLPGAGALGIRVEGSYLTRTGLEDFLATGRGVDAALTSLSVQEHRFQASFKLYGRH